MQLPEGKNLLVVLGPTASGKTSLAVTLARRLSGEIISADSRQVYRGMDIGTGKDLSEYAEVPHHLIDILDPSGEYHLFAFQRDCFAAIEEIRSRGKLPVICGGTGLYLDAVLKGYRLVEVPENPPLRADLAGQSLEQLQGRLLRLRPDQHNRTDLEDRDRLVRAIEIAEGEELAAAGLLPAPPVDPLILGIGWQREELRRRITARLRARLDEGMIEEVAALIGQGISRERLDLFGLEYRFVAAHLAGELNRNDLFQKLNSAIHQFAKRQDTWFRRMERQGTEIHWLDPARDLIEQFTLLTAGGGDVRPA